MRTRRRFTISGLGALQMGWSRLPAHEDDTYDLYAIHQWILKEAATKDCDMKLKRQKTWEEVEKLKLTKWKIQGWAYPENRTRKYFVPSRATSLRTFFERGLSKNRAQRHADGWRSSFTWLWIRKGGDGCLYRKMKSRWSFFGVWFQLKTKSKDYSDGNIKNANYKAECQGL